MKPYIVSLLAGILAGAIYSLVRVRSPAPPMIALVGLLGMVLGAQLIPTGRQLLTSASLPVARTVAASSHNGDPQPKSSVKLISRAPNATIAN
jgi:XapX domain-containing protein